MTFIQEENKMINTKTFAIAAFITTAAIGTYALAHGTGKNDQIQQMQNSMMGGGMMHKMMGNGMDMNFDQPMFNTVQLTETLNLNNEQISILSQLEASHLVMHDLMKAYITEDGQINHNKMMSMMTENMKLMTEHSALYQQFSDSLDETQQDLWQQTNSHCH